MARRNQIRKARLAESRVRLPVRALRMRVVELEETLNAIRDGKVDALVVSSETGDRVFTLQGAEHPYRVLVENMNEGAATVGFDGLVLYANARFAEMFGVPLGRLIGACLFDHVSAEQQNRLKEMLKARHHGAGDLDLHSPSGRRSLLRLSFSEVNAAGVSAIGVIASEVTELVEANEALRVNEDALRQLSTRLLKLQDEERRRISRDLHDVTGQKLAVQAMTLGQLLKTVAANSENGARKALSDCLDLANQISSEIRTMSYLLHPPLLDELGLLSAVRWYTQGFEKRSGIRVEIAIPRGLPRLSPDREVALFRVVQESLANVHRHSGSKTARIQVRANKREIVLEVRDRGSGLQPGALRSLSRNASGSGVGIQGMRERMRLLSGSLTVDSVSGRGTIVRATLPVLDAESEKSLEGPRPVAPQVVAAEQCSCSPFPGARKRILIADDHEVLRQGLKTMLQSTGEWEVCGEAANGHEAVEKTAALRPDLVILDINMPVLNGLAAVRRILLAGLPTRVLMFTVHDSEQTVREIREAGAHGYLSKGNAGQDLVKAIRKLLDGEEFYPAPSASFAAV